MKKSSLIAFLVMGMIFYYVTGGGILLGLGGGYSGPPERDTATVELSGQQQQNPFMDGDSD